MPTSTSTATPIPMDVVDLAARATRPLATEQTTTRAVRPRRGNANAQAAHAHPPDDHHLLMLMGRLTLQNTRHLRE
eukprot:1724700-Heterocapsa_arctica.AAC.1